MAVVITQVGVVSAFGRGVDAYRTGLNSKVSYLQPHDPLKWMVSDLAGVAPNKAFFQYLHRRKAAKLMTSAARLAMDAVGQIWDDSGSELDSVETALFLSVGREPPDEGEAEPALVASAVDGQFSEVALATKGRDLYPPLLPLKTLPNLILGHLSIHFGLQGENAAWAGEGIQSLIEGYWAIEEGRTEKVLVGASDSLIDLGQARDLKRLGIEYAPGEAATAFLLQREVEGQSVLGRISLTEDVQESSLDDIDLIKQIGYCGVVNTQLKILKSLLMGETFQGYGMTIESTLRAEI